MRKFLKWFGISLIALVILAIATFIYMKNETKKHSPEGRVVYTENGYDIEVEYSRPFKKDRDIFGGLVPYGEVWRTGANEPTTFETQSDLQIGSEVLPAGKYTLWTIPGKSRWKVIFNRGDYSWGVDWNMKPTRDPELDVIEYEARAFRTIHVREQFTIDIDRFPPVLLLMWDDIQVEVPLD